ncbi:helix-turn-helix domain-containing protein [Marisediminicola senii]|uniref:hypothetical protein n=1 Tax=Marisediminicola senii TaxID=2711233 RepID=UPI0013EB2C30|nr:hypothetical protein [Marisediminicola senii]
MKRLGGANNALVWTRIQFRCQTPTAVTHTTDDGIWWPATREDIAEETGLTPDQVKHSIRYLIDNGFIADAEHRLNGNHDRRKSYRPIISARPVDRANMPNGAGENTQSDRANMPALLSTKNLKKQEQEELTLIVDEDVPQQDSIEDLFAIFWAAWPRKVDRKDALAAFTRALKKHQSPHLRPLFAERLTAAAKAAAQHWQVTERRPLEKIPHAATWLNAERWHDEIPAPGQPPSPPPRKLTNAEVALARYQQRYGGPDGQPADRAALDRGISGGQPPGH